MTDASRFAVAVGKQMAAARSRQFASQVPTLSFDPTPILGGPFTGVTDAVGTVPLGTQAEASPFTNVAPGTLSGPGDAAGRSRRRPRQYALPDFSTAQGYLRQADDLAANPTPLPKIPRATLSDAEGLAMLIGAFFGQGAEVGSAAWRSAQERGRVETERILAEYQRQEEARHEKIREFREQARLSADQAEAIARGENEATERDFANRRAALDTREQMAQQSNAARLSLADQKVQERRIENYNKAWGALGGVPEDRREEYRAGLASLEAGELPEIPMGRTVRGENAGTNAQLADTSIDSRTGMLVNTVKKTGADIADAALTEQRRRAKGDEGLKRWSLKLQERRVELDAIRARYATSGKAPLSKMPKEVQDGYSLLKGYKAKITDLRAKQAQARSIDPELAALFEEQIKAIATERDRVAAGLKTVGFTPDLPDVRGDVKITVQDTSIGPLPVVTESPLSGNIPMRLDPSRVVATPTPRTSVTRSAPKSTPKPRTSPKQTAKKGKSKLKTSSGNGFVG